MSLNQKQFEILKNSLASQGGPSSGFQQNPQSQQPKTPLANKVANFFGAKGITEQFGADIARARLPESQKNYVDYPSFKEVAGSAIQTGANLLPGAGVGTSLGKKALIGAGTGYAFDVGSKIQNNVKGPLSPGAATIVGAGLPVAGAGVGVASRLIGRLFKGLGSGLSGVSTKTIDSIVQNPEVAQRAAQRLAETGNDTFLEKNAKEVVNGITKIKKEASQAFGKGVESLKATDIAPTTFRQEIQGILDKYGISKSDGTRTLSGVEFDDPKNIKKASGLIDRLSNVDLNGASLRKLADDIESEKYKIAKSDERLSFNAFLDNLSNGLKRAINKSTDKLGEINAAYSKDMQLAETAQNIFGKVKFNNLPEVVKASQKLESLFSQKGLAPREVDNFLQRIGVSPENFKTDEAVRQITDKTTGANTKGLSFGEILQQVTSSIVTPKMVRDIAIFTGLGERKSQQLINALGPGGTKVLLNLLQQGRQSQATAPQQGPQ